MFWFDHVFPMVLFQAWTILSCSYQSDEGIKVCLYSLLLSFNILFICLTKSMFHVWSPVLISYLSAFVNQRFVSPVFSRIVLKISSLSFGWYVDSNFWFTKIISFFPIRFMAFLVCFQFLIHLLESASIHKVWYFSIVSDPFRSFFYHVYYRCDHYRRRCKIRAPVSSLLAIFLLLGLVFKLTNFEHLD